MIGIRQFGQRVGELPEAQARNIGLPIQRLETLLDFANLPELATWLAEQK